MFFFFFNFKFIYLFIYFEENQYLDTGLRGEVIDSTFILAIICALASDQIFSVNKSNIILASYIWAYLEEQGHWKQTNKQTKHNNHIN